MLAIRLTRAGAKKRPYYRIIAIDSRKPRQGRPLEYLGTYDPNPAVEKIAIEAEKIEGQFRKGIRQQAQPRGLVSVIVGEQYSHENRVTILDAPGQKEPGLEWERR